MDNFHFYRAHPLLAETRFTKSFLNSFDVQVFGGSTNTAYNNCGRKVPLFGRIGCEDFKEFPVNFSFDREKFKKDFCSGRFNIVETQLQAFINLDCGFFAHFHLPIRRFKLKHVFPLDKRNPLLTDKLNANMRLLEQELNKHHLSTCNFKKTGVGDFTALIGWTGTTYDTAVLDYLDLTLQTGILFPTSKKQDLSHIFDIPFGYNGHYANTLIVDGATGFCDWLTFGAHVEALFFWDTNQKARLNSRNLNLLDYPCTGFIRLDKACARVKEGNIWSASAYIKADHCISGFSLTLGYSHDHQNAGGIFPLGKHTEIATITHKQDPLLSGWDMNIFHFILEYDCADEELLSAPRFGLAYNHIISGKNIFRNSTLGGFLGINCVWDF